MCNYKTWYYEEKTGYVIECDKCKKMQVGFGTVQLTFNEEDFTSFRKYLEDFNKGNDTFTKPGIKNFFIPTSCAGVSLLLNKRELDDLNNMLDHADNEMRAAELIGLFYQEEKG